MITAPVMDIPSCHIPPVLLGLIDEDGRLVANDSTRGIQLLALVCAKEANEMPTAAVIPLRGRA